MFCNINTREMKRNISMIKIWKKDTAIILINDPVLFNTPCNSCPPFTGQKLN